MMGVSPGMLSPSSSLSKQTLTKALQDLHSNHPLTTHRHKCSAFKHLKSIHASMIKTNAHHDSFLINQFTAACSRLRRTDHAILAVAQMSAPNAFVFNALIAGLARSSSPHSALHIYQQMSRSGVAPTSYTFPPLFKACAHSSAAGRALHGGVVKMGFGSQVFVQTGLIEFYSNSDKMVESRQVFDEMPQRDLYAWTTMVAAHARAGDMDSAGRLFREMPERNTVAWNTMTAGYARAGDIERAAAHFNEMPGRDLVSWTTMISCYSQNSRFREAVEVFEAMTAAGVSPDGVTMAAVISACAHLGALCFGREMHRYAMLAGFDPDVYIGSALVDMYAKCGSIERALVVFFKLKEKNLFCWNSIIEGLGMHGHGEEALDMFSRMKKEAEVEPNWVTFVSVLSACTHAGLVEQGRRIFSCMISDHLIVPRVEHYGCMVDLLGRAGFLQEALDLIGSMTMEPNPVIWGALLGACKVHRNLEIGEIAVQKLMGLEPDNSGYYLLLINMYAEANRWHEIAAVRRAMRGRGVEKRSPGCSWIEMDGLVHEFAASDMSHSAADEVCFLLVGLDGQLKLAGYIPEYA